MDLRLNEFQGLLQSSAAEFLEREVPEDRVRAMETAAAPDQDLWQQLTDLGWTGLPLAEAVGGQGATILDHGLLVEELCRAAVLSPYQQTMSAALTVQRWADETRKQEILPPVVAGRTLTPAFFDAADARAAGTTYSDGCVTGAKSLVEYGGTSDSYLVSAHANGEPGLAVVPRDQTAVSIRELRSIGSMPQVAVEFQEAVAEAWLPGKEAVDYLRLLSTAMTALEAYAYAQQTLDMTVEYVQMRVQFGRPIGTFGAVQSRCADMAIQVEASKFLTRELLYHFDQDEVDPVQVATVKAITAGMAPDVAMDAHLIHGGIGVMREYRLHFYSRRAKEASLRWAGVGECLNTVADALVAGAAG
jgi:alkylation response protein AidB-like acyl-CoA dehydrogenase